jgi:hypothetical protein
MVTHPWSPGLRLPGVFSLERLEDRPVAGNFALETLFIASVLSPSTHGRWNPRWISTNEDNFPPTIV